MNKLNKIESEINELIYLLNKTDNEEEKTKIHFSLIMLLEVFNEYSYVYSSEYYKYKKTSYNVLQYVRKTVLEQLSQTYDEDYKNMIIKLTENCKPLLENFNHYKSSLTTTFTIDEAKILILDFFSSYDKSLIPIIKKALSEENLFIKTDPILGFSHKPKTGFFSYNPYSKTPYIYVNNGGKEINLNTICTIVHELGHVINAYLNYQFAKTNSNNLGEVPSCTFDSLFLLYLLDNNILTDDTEAQINSNIQYTLFNIESLIKSNERKISLQKLGFSSLNSLDNDPYKYSYGHLLSYYYLNLYKRDPEKTKYYIYQFIKNIGLRDDLHMLNNFGITQDEFTSCQSLKEEIKRNQKRLQFINEKNI